MASPESEATPEEMEESPGLDTVRTTRLAALACGMLGFMVSLTIGVAKGLSDESLVTRSLISAAIMAALGTAVGMFFASLIKESAARDDQDDGDTAPHAADGGSPDGNEDPEQSYEIITEYSGDIEERTPEWVAAERPCHKERQKKGKVLWNAGKTEGKCLCYPPKDALFVLAIRLPLPERPDSFQPPRRGWW